MTARLLISAVIVAAGFAAPAAAGETRWIDPWAPYGVNDELAGGPAAEARPYVHARSQVRIHADDGTVWIDPWGDDCRCREDVAFTGYVDTAGFTGGVGNRQIIFFSTGGFYFNRSLPAGQAVMTGDRARPFHPLGRPRF